MTIVVWVVGLLVMRAILVSDGVSSVTLFGLRSCVSRIEFFGGVGLVVSVSLARCAVWRVRLWMSLVWVASVSLLMEVINCVCLSIVDRSVLVALMLRVVIACSTVSIRIGFCVINVSVLTIFVFVWGSFCVMMVSFLIVVARVFRVSLCLLVCRLGGMGLVVFVFLGSCYVVLSVIFGDAVVLD